MGCTSAVAAACILRNVVVEWAVASRVVEWAVASRVVEWAVACRVVVRRTRIARLAPVLITSRFQMFNLSMRTGLFKG